MIQKKEVLRYLQTHKRGITSGEAWSKFGITRLADVIWKLRRDGYKVNSEMVKVKTRRGFTRVARYSLGI